MRRWERFSFRPNTSVGLNLHTGDGSKSPKMTWCEYRALPDCHNQAAGADADQATRHGCDGALLEGFRERREAIKLTGHVESSTQ